jgi:hypothetical protein
MAGKQKRGQSLELYDADSFIVLAQIGVLLPFWIALQQLPGNFIRDSPVFARNEALDGCGFCLVLKFFLQFDPQGAAHAAGPITMDQLDCRIALFACDLQLMLHAQPGLFHFGHAIFQIHDLDGRRLSRHDKASVVALL